MAVWPPGSRTTHFPSRDFDFMLSNWKTRLERVGQKGGLKGARFPIEHDDAAEHSLETDV